jgi:transposase-like protein
MAYVDLSLPQFHQQFGTEESCLQAVFDARWPRGFVCPYCQHNDGYRLSTRPRIVQCALCRRQSSITANTVFHRSHVALSIWFLAIYLIAQDKGGASAKRLQNQLGVSYPTAWFLVQRIHCAMSRRDENLTLAGYIELDEAFFGGRHKNTSGKRKPPSGDKVQVLVLVESEGKNAGNLVMKVIANDQLEGLKPVIQDKIEADPPGQWFRSDAWGSHHAVMQFGHRIKMEHVPNSRQDEVLRCVNLAISNAKAFFKGTYHNFCKTHIQRYLDEFCYRWNRRHLFSQLASHLISACSLAGVAPYKTVIAPKPTAA